MNFNLMSNKNEAQAYPVAFKTWIYAGLFFNSQTDFRRIDKSDLKLRCESQHLSGNSYSLIYCSLCYNV